MIDVVDIVVLLLVGAAAFLGYRQGLIRQICSAVGVTTGLCITAFAYGSLAFLSQKSGTRSILLLILLLAVVLLCYSASLAIGSSIEHRWRSPAKGFWASIRKVGGGLVAVFTAGFAIWMVAVMFNGVLPAGLQQQISRSQVLGAVKRVAAAPPLFRDVTHLLQPFTAPSAFAASEPAFNGAESSVNSAFDELDSAIARAQPSVVKIEAWGCGSTAEGSGFIVDKRLIMTNAHILAGAGRISVVAGGTTYTAQAIRFDPELDAAVLFTATDLPAAPLALRAEPLQVGSIGAVLGYPGNGGLKVRDATVLQLLNATGYDIYGKSKTTRDIYAIRSTVEPGNSGGPLIDTDGRVAGLVFGNSTSQTLTGYAIAAGQIQTTLQALAGHRSPVSTGSCTGE